MTKHASAASRIAATTPACRVTGGPDPASISTAPAPASDRTYCAALKSTLTGAVRANKSAITDAAAYTAHAGSTPTESSTANANAVEIVTLSSPLRRGTGMGNNSPASTNNANSQNRTGVSTVQPTVNASAAAAAAAAPTVSAVKPTKRRGIPLMPTPSPLRSNPMVAEILPSPLSP